MTTLKTSSLGLQLKNPIIASSSGLTDSVYKLKDLEKYGVAAVVLKSIFEEEILMEMEESMHQMVGRPYVFPETYDYMNRDFKEDCVQSYLSLIREAKKNLSIPVIASINCVSPQKWNYLCKKITEAGADAIQLNLFFLPSNPNSDIYDSIYKTRSIIRGVQSLTSLPISVKVGPYHSNLAGYLKELESLGVAGVTLFNRTYNPDFNIRELKLIDHGVLTTPDANYETMRWVALMSKLVSFDLSASGGIHGAHQLIKQILAGAQTVEIASTLYKNGLSQISQMLDGLHGYMVEQEYDSLEAMRGKMAADVTVNRQGWERTQFMKFFSNYASDHLFEK